jgi:hypothetical protein
MSTWKRSTRTRVARLFVAVVALGLSLLYSAPASAAVAPAVTLDDARAYNNLIEPGDFFFMLQYVLPISGTTNWCTYLNNTAGCADTPASPDEPTSLLNGYAWVELYSAAGATLEVQQQPLRIDYALGGIYIAPGSAFTWPPTDMRVCISPEPSAFDAGTAVSSCLAPGYDTLLTSRQALARDLGNMVTNIQAGRDLPANSLVIAGQGGAFKVTSDGRKLALEALSVMDQIIPSAFQAASTRALSTPYATPVEGSSSLQTAIDSSSQGLIDIGAGIGSIFGIQSGRTMLFIVWALLGLIAGLALYGMSAKRGNGEPVFVVFGIGGGMMVGMWTGGPSVATVFLTLFLLAVFAVFAFIRTKAPSTSG